MDIFKSASKLVFLILAIAACIGFFIGKLEAKDFMLLAVSAFSFYFSIKK
jgi:asparagine N-glycosylation enzyme membrane subunit Stt3